MDEKNENCEIIGQREQTILNSRKKHIPRLSVVVLPLLDGKAVEELYVALTDTYIMAMSGFRCFPFSLLPQLFYWVDPV